MKARGHGLPGRSAFSIYIFDKRDLKVLIYLFSCASTVIAGAVTQVYHFRFFPTINGEWTGFWTILVFAAYFLLSAFPLIINIREDILWKLAFARRDIL
jgi:energy-coupling factor transport system permease protein